MKYIAAVMVVLLVGCQSKDGLVLEVDAWGGRNECI